MSLTITELLEAEIEPMPFDILRAAYVELAVRDLAASRHFYVDLLGLVVSAETSDALYLRGWEERVHHSIVLRQADRPAAARLGFRTRGDADLDGLARVLEGLGCTVWWADGALPQMGRALRVQDPFGFPLEFFNAIGQ